jgi:hypothetical protein
VRAAWIVIDVVFQESLYAAISMTATPTTRARGHPPRRTGERDCRVLQAEGNHELNICRAGLDVNVDPFADGCEGGRTSI